MMKYWHQNDPMFQLEHSKIEFVSKPDLRWLIENICLIWIKKYMYIFNKMRERLILHLFIMMQCKSCLEFTIMFKYTMEPLLWGHPFFTRKLAFREGWPLIRGKNQYIYVKNNIVKWSFKRGWPLKRGSTIYVCMYINIYIYQVRMA